MTDIEKAREMPSEKSMEKARETISKVMPAYPTVLEAAFATAFDEMQSEIDRLRHDIDRHVSIAAAEAQRAEAAIAETREECASRADGLLMTAFDDWDDGFNAGLRALASAIRATGKESER